MKLNNKILLEAKRLDKWDNTADVKELLNMLNEGIILEIGCGTGTIIESLSNCLNNSKFYGIDIEPHFIQRAKNKKIQNAEFLVANATKIIFKANSFDTVILRDSLHEIREKDGKKGVFLALKNIYYYLKEGGSLIIRDGLTPNQKKIEFVLASRKMEHIFEKFIEYSNRKFKKKDNRIVMLAKDFVYFLSKIKKIESVSTSLEESKHYNLKEYKEILNSSGFEILSLKKYKFSVEKYPDIIINKKEMPFSYIMFLCKKIIK